MGIFSNLFEKAKSELGKYTGDTIFLHGATAAAALVVNADGVIEDAEIDAAIKVLSSNIILHGSFKPSDIESSLNEALSNSKTRSGKAVLNRQVEQLITRPIEQRQDVFFIAADVGDTDKTEAGTHGIGDKEMAVLQMIAKTLTLDVNKLLA